VGHNSGHERALVALSHVTTYAYRRPVDFHPHRLLLRPRDDGGLRVVAHQLRCSPSAAVRWSQDLFGNLLATARFSAMETTLTISNHLVLDIDADAWPVFPIEPRAQAYPFAYTSDEQSDLAPLRDATGVDETVCAWARGFVAAPTTDTLSLLKDINAGVQSAVRYCRRDEPGAQDGAATLKSRRGSCRDLAALFNEAVRSLGFGARAVSGYLIDQRSEQTLSDTMHAWSEVYLPGAGWITFDPTHARMGRAGLIPVAVGRRSEQVLPITGGFAGAVDDLVSMTVTIEADMQDVASSPAERVIAAHAPGLAESGVGC
jgi:transglutaminase-like putative cysteine protease